MMKPDFVAEGRKPSGSLTYKKYNTSSDSELSRTGGLAPYRYLSAAKFRDANFISGGGALHLPSKLEQQFSVWLDQIIRLRWPRENLNWDFVTANLFTKHCLPT